MAYADTTLIIWGAGHLAGQTVSVCVGGIDCGDFVVATDGSVSVPYGSDVGIYPGDPGGRMTVAYLKALSGTYGGSNHDVTFSVNDGSSNTSVTVPIVVGLKYTSQGQVVRPATAADIASQEGPALGKTRRGHSYALLVSQSVQISVGTSLTGTLYPAVYTLDGGASIELAQNATQPYTGVHFGTLPDAPGYDTMLCWQVNRPWSCTIMAASTFLESAER